MSSMEGSPGALTRTRSLPKNSLTAVTLSVLRCPRRRWLPLKWSPPTKSWALSKRPFAISKPCNSKCDLFITRPMIGSKVTCFCARLPMQWHMKQRLAPLFAADGTHKDRQWTMRNVIERLAAIRREKIAMAGVEFEKVTTPQADQQSILDHLQVRL